MARRPKLTEVAEAAGISVAAASDALNGKGRVADATRERVLKVAEGLGYRPHPGARSLVTGRTMTLGLRVGPGPTIPSGSFFLELLNGASTAAAERGYALLITSRALDESVLVDGILVVDPTVAEDVELPLHGGLPVVTVGRSPAVHERVPRVDSDHEAATTMLLEHLHARRPEGPMWLLGLPGRVSFARDIERAFLAWTAVHGRIAHVVRCADSEVDVARAVASALATRGAPAVVCSVLDRQGAWAQRLLLAAGLAVPKDVLLAAATDGETLEMSGPPITAIDPGGREAGRLATELLIDRIEGRSVSGGDLLIAPRLVIRGSTSP